LKSVWEDKSAFERSMTLTKDISYVMGDKVLKIGSVHQCNCCMGSKTLHPLVSLMSVSVGFTFAFAQQNRVKSEFEIRMGG